MAEPGMEDVRLWQIVLINSSSEHFGYIAENAVSRSSLSQILILKIPALRNAILLLAPTREASAFLNTIGTNRTFHSR